MILKVFFSSSDPTQYVPFSNIDPYPSCSSLFISSFVYYTIDFQVTCLYYREGNLGKGCRVNNLFFHQPIT